MNKQVLFRLALALTALSSIAPSMMATEFEATLRPISTSPSKDKPFVDPLVEVGFIFDRCIKLFDTPSVLIKCDGNVVASAVSLDIDNYVGETTKQGT